VTVSLAGGLILVALLLAALQWMERVREHLLAAETQGLLNVGFIYSTSSGQWHMIMAWDCMLCRVTDRGIGNRGVKQSSCAD